MIELDSGLPSELVPLSWLLGVWEGTGVVNYDAEGGEPRHYEFGHRVSFSHDGLPHVNYTSYTWLIDPDAGGDSATESTPLATETGYWRLSRPATESDPGPGLLPGIGVRPFNTTESVETLRNAAGGFDIEVSLVHPGGVSELYVGQVKGARIDLSTDAVLRSANSKEHAASTRLYGLVDNHLLWAWDIAALGLELRTHASEGLLVSNEFLALPGAVAAGDLGVAAHYGDPFREQRALAEGTAIVDLSHRSVVTVSGPDRLTWIDSITSQSVARLEPGESSETLVLDQNGRLEYAAGLIDDGETLWMLVDAESAPGLVTWLDRMRFMLRVEVADRSADYAAIGSRAGIIDAASPHGVSLDWRDPWSGVMPGGYQYAAEAEHPALDWAWTEQIVERSRLADIAHGSAVAGLLAYDALRIAAWRPARETEVDEKSIPHELDWLRTAVHLNKGCYRGQETVAKVHNLGHPPRRLVMLHLDGSDDVLPGAGDEVRSGDVVVGRVTSAAQHYELGPIALAVIKRTTDATAPLVVMSNETAVAAAQEIVVPTDAGAVAGVARLPRLGAVRR